MQYIVCIKNTSDLNICSRNEFLKSLEDTKVAVLIWVVLKSELEMSWVRSVWEVIPRSETKGRKSESRSGKSQINVILS